MKMSEEQFEALRYAVRTTCLEIHNVVRSDSEAWDALRRLLVEPEPIDPGLTTFGELEQGDWFQVLRSGLRCVKPPKHLREVGLCAIDLRGRSHLTPDSTPVKRLPKPEFKA